MPTPTTAPPRYRFRPALVDPPPTVQVALVAPAVRMFVVTGFVEHRPDGRRSVGHSILPVLAIRTRLDAAGQLFDELLVSDPAHGLVTAAELGAWTDQPTRAVVADWHPDADDAKLADAVADMEAEARRRWPEPAADPSAN